MDLIFETEQEGVQITLDQLHQEKPVLLVLLRHIG
ncbi:hypothetical protein SAMN05216243_0922 [Sediminibacillus albus]|uniref:AhpC/TSA family protein n=1 Tax=Sediminibacillus albus TaxID=407036 RepID=A0A1G8WP69_9BACI|nr:hypothetical protein SAMN05216243_0922 [Sediminibacillus albus]